MQMAKPSMAVLNHAALLPLLLVLVSVLVTTVVFTRPKPEEITSTQFEEVIAMPTAEIFGVKIERNPPQSKLDELGVTNWPKWSGQPSKIPWTFKARETMYLLEGKVKVSVDGHEGSFEIRAGDLVVFPKGMQITWDVLETVNKHYSLEKGSVL